MTCRHTIPHADCRACQKWLLARAQDRVARAEARRIASGCVHQTADERRARAWLERIGV